MSSTSAIAVLAQGLRELRDFAEGPDGEDLQQRTGLTAQQIQAALDGERLPTREVTLALVEAWEGDVGAWRDYWGQISELTGEDDSGDESNTAAATPTPPEPSIITPIPEGEGEEGDGEARKAGETGEGGTSSGGVGGESEAAVEEAAAEQDAVRARSAARAQLEANAQATKAQSEAKASARDERAVAQAQQEAPEQEQEHVEEERAEEAQAQAEAEQEAAGSEPGAQERLADAGAGGAEGGVKLTGEPAIPAQRTASSSEEAAAKKPSSPVVEGVVVSGGTPKPAGKGMLARAGIPVLVFAVGVGVGAFGDHALSSKQSSTNSSASVPLASGSSSSKPSHSVTSSAAPTGTPSSVGGSASGPLSPTDTASAGVGAGGTDTSASSSSTIAPGTALGTYVGIQLASGYSVNFLNDPYHPASGTSNGPDTMGFFAGSFVDGRFYADRVAILDSTDSGSYTSCLNDTRYQHDVLLSQVAAGSSFCVTTGTGHVVLVTVRRLPSSTDANPYAVLDVTVWQGD